MENCPVCNNRIAGKQKMLLGLGKLNDGNRICHDCYHQLSQDIQLTIKKHSSEDVKRILQNTTEVIEASKNIIVTTVDLKQEYEVLGVVYFKVSNKGLFSDQLKTLTKKYKAEIAHMKANNQVADKFDWGFMYGELSFGMGNEFDSAFFVATKELQQRAARLGADAIVGMKQDIDIDSNGFQYFYLQMYGTAVKFK